MVIKLLTGIPKLAKRGWKKQAASYDERVKSIEKKGYKLRHQLVKEEGKKSYDLMEVYTKKGPSGKK